MFRLFLLLFILLPQVIDAAVIVSEVAWMGSTESANHEWIELHNTSATAVDITGWTLSDGMNLSIPLSGSISANSYAVLERSSEASAPGTALLIYSGALVNTGATLTLRRGDGAIEDQVAGGENWENIGGDNATKETAQYTTSGWITAEATPKSANKSIGTEPVETKSEPTKSGPLAKPAFRPDETTQLILPGVTLALEVNANKLGYVNQAINFDVAASDIGGTLIDSLSYEWNFGNGETMIGKKVTHQFKYPGTYVVTVYGNYKRQEQVARHEITILPVQLSITRSVTGDLQINNDSPYEIDMSGYSITGPTNLTFPPRTILLANQTITISKEKTAGYRAVKDTSHKIIATEWGNRSVEIADTTIVTTPAVRAPLTEFTTIEPVSNPNFGFVSDEVPVQVATTTVLGDSDFIIIGSSTDETVPIRSERWPYYVLIALLLFGIGGILYRKQE